VDAYCDDPTLAYISDGCNGTRLVHIFGMIMFLFILVTVTAQLLSSGLIYYYFTSSSKKKYRVYAQAMLIIAPFIDLFVLCGFLYASMVYADLWKNGSFGAVLHLGKRNMSWCPVGGCFWAALFNCMLMFVIPFIVNVLKTKNERLLREARMQKEFELEMARYAHEYDAGAGGGYGGGGGGGGDGYDPYGGGAYPSGPPGGYHGY